jgi:hypothetical protein
MSTSTFMPLRGRFGSVVTKSLLPLIVFGAAIWVFASAAGDLPFNGDEIDYIGNARYFNYLFLEHDIENPAWDDNYWTHTQPMLTRYVVGGWLWVRGYDLNTMPFPYYDFDVSLEENVREGRVPERALINDARLPSVVFAAGAATLLYLLGRILSGALAGLTASLLMIINPLARQHMATATPEALLCFLLLLTLLLAVLGARSSQTSRLPALWALAVGLALALALQTKLTATFSLSAIGTWGIGVALLAWLRARGPWGDRLRQSWLAGRGWLIAVAVAVIVFMAGNPHLYPDPVRHTAHLFEQRAEEMQFQREWRPEWVTHGPLDRVRYVLGGSLVMTGERLDGDPSAWRGLPLAALLAPVGVLALIIRGWQVWREQRRLPIEGLVLITALAYFAGIAAGIHMYWPRYLVPTTLLGALFSGLGLAVLFHRLLTVYHHAIAVRRDRPLSSDIRL